MAVMGEWLVPLWKRMWIKWSLFSLGVDMGWSLASEDSRCYRLGFYEVLKNMCACFS